MRKVHVVMKKEDIKAGKWSKQSVAVVFDVLLATSSIVSALANGAKEVIPVLHKEEARDKARIYPVEDTIISGKYNGITIEGFHPPNPLWLRNNIRNKRLILSTTNGTVAIRNAANASPLYLCSLLNIDAVAESILKEQNEEIVLICSGSGGSFSMEDFFGAGALVEALSEKEELMLSDAALTARHLYRVHRLNPYRLLTETRVGNMLMEFGLEQDIQYVATLNKYTIAPVYEKTRGTIKEVTNHEYSSEVE
ncbi:2-phosphosulfolactate phosphatase [Pontibacillus salicampi]|uniref:Probable 2-phosphosulfolactate phosphatase n=1 Tax=Pontibacillus salicampi TaxID=1449801 RepID=A0ABV6LKR6_9BACI